MNRFWYERAEIPLPVLNDGVPPPALRVPTTRSIMTQRELLIQPPAGALVEDADLAAQALEQARAVLGDAAWISADAMNIYESLVSDESREDWLAKGYQIQLDPPACRYAALDAVCGEVTVHWTALIGGWWSLFFTLPATNSVGDGEVQGQAMPVIIEALRTFALPLADERWTVPADGTPSDPHGGFSAEGEGGEGLRAAVRVYGGDQPEVRRLGVQIQASGDS